MANFPQLPYPSWLKDIINPRNRASVNGSGFQGAHQIGADNWAKNDFSTKFNSLAQFGIGADASSNGEMLAQSQRGGMVLGATNHDGPHPEALNVAQYDATLTRGTVLNELAAQTADIDDNNLLSADEKSELHQKVAREFYIYQRYNASLNLDQEFLDKIASESGEFKPKVIANNNADWRSGTSEFDGKSSGDYLSSQEVKDSHLYENAKKSSL